MGIQGEIRDLAQGGEDGILTVEIAEEVVKAQRRILRIILPTLPDDVAASITDAEVVDVIRFFEEVRITDAEHQMDQQLEPVERMVEKAEKARRIGDNWSRRSNDSTGATQLPG